jgi:hypoxanthine-guanine phosphoribosyltransferase
MKLVLQGFGLAALGGCFLYIGYTVEVMSGAAIILGGLLMYLGASFTFEELRVTYYRRQKERRGS